MNEDEKMFMVRIARKAGGWSFIGYDSYSGGYPYFTDNFATTSRHETVLSAIEEARIVPNMANYNGGAEHDLDKVVVSELVFKNVCEVGEPTEADLRREIAAEALEGMPEEAIEALREFFQNEKK